VAYKVDSLNLGYCVRWQQGGLKVNRDIRTQEEIEYKEKLVEVKKLLPPGLNVNSYKQVRKLLSDTDGREVTQSDADYLLQRISEGCKYSRAIIDERGIIKTLKFLDTYNRDRVYGHFNPYGTRTGRWSCKGGDREEAVNMQQLPRKLKKVFGYTQDEDKIFVGADLPTAELRLIAAVYGEKTMADAFRNDIDLHKLTASRTTGKDVEDITGDERKKAKAENFGLCYGMGAKTFQQYAFSNYDIVLTLEEAEERRNNWMSAYPDQASTIARIKKQFFAGNMVVKTLLNRWVQPDMYTDAVNIPIQGGIAEISKIWIHYMHEMHGGPVPIANMVHDSVTIESNLDDVEYWSDIMRKSCDKAWKYYMSLPGIIIKDINMPLEIGISKSYGGAS
jgi:DNA polymerase I-like protein with 3'-5' exonuclease and polymerase domains